MDQTTVTIGLWLFLGALVLQVGAAGLALAVPACGPVAWRVGMVANAVLGVLVAIVAVASGFGVSL